MVAWAFHEIIVGIATVSGQKPVSESEEKVDIESRILHFAIPSSSPNFNMPVFESDMIPL